MQKVLADDCLALELAHAFGLFSKVVERFALDCLAVGMVDFADSDLFLFLCFK
jgi:hypothetical protein